MSARGPSRAGAGLACAAALGLGCTTVGADARRRDIVVAVERMATIPVGFTSPELPAIRVVRLAGDVDHAPAAARRDGETLVLERAGVELWRGPVAEVQALELRRTHTRETRLRADADDAGFVVAVVSGLAVFGLLAVALAFEAE